MKSPSTISIKLGNTDISDMVVYNQTSFQSQSNPIQGSFKVTLRDLDHDFTPTVGKKLTCHIDGVPLFGGYVMRIGRGNFFPAVDTPNPSAIKTRKWILEGPDFNVLFDKRVLRDPSDYTSVLEVPSGKRTISKAYKYLMNNFIDVPAGLDFVTHCDVIDGQYGTEENGGRYLGQGQTWREQMEDFAEMGGLVYYIDADFKVHLHRYEETLSPWVFVDIASAGVNTVRFREGEYTKDFTRAATEALVWGGSTIRKPGGPGGEIVFAKYPDPPANDATWFGQLQSAEKEQKAIDRRNELGRWQVAEERAGQSNYLTLASVKNRAYVMINGVPGDPPNHGIEGGFSAPIEQMSAAWFAHDVPGKDHVKPGTLQTFILYSQGKPAQPLVTTLPCRSMRVTFPTLPTDNPGGQTYVRFDGEFSSSYGDSRHLWRYLRKKRGAVGSSTIVVDNNNESAPPGSLATLWPNETANGTRTQFTYKYRFYLDQFDLFLNGLFQRPSIDYSYDPSLKQVTFATAPGVGDQQWATGYVSQ
jgi:hypothetical protein